MIEISSNISDYLISLYGEEKARKYFNYIKEEPSQYIRINQLLSSEEELIPSLSGYGIKLEKSDVLPFAFKVIEGADVVGKTLELNLGHYYIQSLSSMIPPIALNPGGKDIVLDLCAAPGSKTTQIAGMMKNKGTLISNESNLDRIKMLVHNLDKMNFINTGVIQYRGEWLSRIYNNYFDKILVDAPCSALGVIQKKNEVSNWWSSERVEKIASIQLMLISSAIKMIKIGGEIVYSTCTLTLEENELIINHVLNKYPLEVIDIDLPVKSEEGFTSYKNEKLNSSLSKAKRILPWEFNSEGFFIIKLRKNGEINSSKELNIPKGDLQLLTYRNKEFRKKLDLISQTFGIPEDKWQDYKFLFKGNDVFFVNQEWNDENLSLFTRIGTRFGSIDKRDNMNLHSFGARILQSSIKENLYHLEDKKDLQEYIRGGTIKVEHNLKEQQIIKYRNNVLGTAAPVPNGLKSQYPKSMRMQEIVFI